MCGNAADDPSMHAASAYAAAVAHPYHVSTFPDWRAYNGVTVGFQSESEARRFASLRPENLIDLVAKGRGVIAARRLIPHPDDPNIETWRAFDDFDDFPGPGPCACNCGCEPTEDWHSDPRCACRDLRCPCVKEDTDHA